MDGNSISRHRIVNQQVQHSSFTTPQELLGWMGAMQAQDYRMVKWALGIRLPGATKAMIEKAIEDGEIIRTHLLRPTWHFVAADDLRWLLKLTAPRIKVAIRSRHKQLGITDEVISQSNAVIADALGSGDHLTRRALVDELEEAGFENKDNLASHLLLRAELDGIICSGASKGKNHTYALMEDRVPETETINKEEAQAKLARIYFRSHGPATLEDFTWWSGLTKTSARKGLEMVKEDFISEEFDAQTYWFAEDTPAAPLKKSAFLLPAYDEFLISYRNRSMVIPDDENRKRAISNNGIFRPVILVNGQIVGIWKRSVKKDQVIIETEFFETPSDDTTTMVEEAAGAFTRFLGRELQITHGLK